MEKLVESIRKLRSDPQVESYDEAQTKQGIVLRILDLLGWDIFTEVLPEYVVGNRRVDFALRLDNANEVFIEVKKPGEDLEDHQEQLLDYSFREGVELAVLTNGITWWLYLPMKKGGWQERKVYSVEFTEQRPEDVADKLAAVLSRQNVSSGKAVKEAEAIYKGHQRKKQVLESLPQAWDRIVTEPDSLLVELLAETAERICGFKPSEEEVDQFLRSNTPGVLLGGRVTPLPSSAPKKLRRAATERSGRGAPEPGVRSMRVGRDSFEFRYANEILVNVAEWLVKEGRLDRAKCPVRITTRGFRYLVHKEPVHSNGQRFTNPKSLSNGLYIEVHGNANQCESFARRLLEALGVPGKTLKVARQSSRRGA